MLRLGPRPRDFFTQQLPLPLPSSSPLALTTDSALIISDTGTGDGAYGEETGAKGGSMDGTGSGTGGVLCDDRGYDIQLWQELEYVISDM